MLKRLMLIRFLFIACVFWLVHPLHGKCSTIRYIECGEETPEFNRVLPKLYSSNTFKEGFTAMVDLAKEGDYCAYVFVSGYLKPRNSELYSKFVMEIRSTLTNKRRFDTLAKIGKLFLDEEDPSIAALFMRPAIENLNLVTMPKEDLEYNYALALCTSQTTLKNNKFDPYHECWRIVKKYLDRDDELFSALQINFFRSLQQNNQDKLINEVGHYLIENQSFAPHAISFFIRTFKKTPHWERLLRQGDAIVIRGVSREELARAWEEKVNRTKSYIKKTTTQVEQYAIQEVLTLLKENQEVKKEFAQYKVKTVSELNDKQKRSFSWFLIQHFNHRIFVAQNIDVAEFLEDVNMREGLYSKGERQDFLITAVLPKLKDAESKSIATQVQQVIYNRLVIILRDDKQLANKMSQVMAQLQKNNEEELIATLADLILNHGQYKQIVFADIQKPKNAKQTDEEPSAFGTYISSLADNQKKEVVRAALKQLIFGE